MNLIQEYGGYDKAKAASKRIDVRSIGYKKLKKALLQYRREHGMYEVGDPVIRHWNNQLYYICHDVDNGSEFLIAEKPNTPVSKCRVCEMPCNLKHATDAEIEIEAMRRLDDEPKWGELLSLSD